MLGLLGVLAIAGVIIRATAEELPATVTLGGPMRGTALFQTDGGMAAEAGIPLQVKAGDVYLLSTPLQNVSAKPVHITRTAVTTERGDGGAALVYFPDDEYVPGVPLAWGPDSKPGKPVTPKSRREEVKDVILQPGKSLEPLYVVLHVNAKQTAAVRSVTVYYTAGDGKQYVQSLPVSLKVGNSQ